MKAIALSFTLKGQDEAQIIQKIREVAQRNPEVVLIHGFLPRHVVREKGWSTGILDTFDELFPSQIRCYSANMMWRDNMAVVASKLEAKVIVIGEEKEGVREEVKLYRGLQLVVEYLPLEEATTPYPNGTTLP